MEEKMIIFQQIINIILSIFLFLLSACTVVGTSISPTVIGPTISPNPNASPTATPFGPSADTVTFIANALVPSPASTFIPPSTTLTPTLSSEFIPSTYTLSIMMDISDHTVSVDETIAYQNSTGEILTELVLAIEPNLWKDCFFPGALSVNGQMIRGAILHADRLELPLAEKLDPDEKLSLFFHYDLQLPPADVYHVFGYNERQTNLVDWYPFIVPYVPGEGWLLHPPSNVGEHLVYDVQNVDMTLHMAKPDAVVIIAASSPAEKITDGWRYRLEKVRSFALSASTDFQTASTEVDGITLTSYFFESESGQGQTVLGEVAKATKTFDLLFGPVPYQKITIVESPFYDGMEYDGLFFLSRSYYTAENGTVLNNLIDIAIHETAHQWWFGSIGNDQAREPWLDEALSTYSERLFYEQNYPQVKGWQAFRIDAYAPTGWVDMDIYHGMDFQTYANAVYLRGAQFMQALRGQIGDDAFFTFLKDYATQMAGKRATMMDFFRILRFHTNADITDIVSVYFQSPP